MSTRRIRYWHPSFVFLQYGGWITYGIGVYLDIETIGNGSNVLLISAAMFGLSGVILLLRTPSALAAADPSVEKLETVKDVDDPNILRERVLRLFVGIVSILIAIALVLYVQNVFSL